MSLANQNSSRVPITLWAGYRQATGRLQAGYRQVMGRSWTLRAGCGQATGKLFTLQAGYRWVTGKLQAGYRQAGHGIYRQVMGRLWEVYRWVTGRLQAGYVPYGQVMSGLQASYGEVTGRSWILLVGHNQWAMIICDFKFERTENHNFTTTQYKPTCGNLSLLDICPSLENYFEIPIQTLL